MAMTDPFWPASLTLLTECEPDTAYPDRRMFLTRCKTEPTCCPYCGVLAERLYKHGIHLRQFNEVPAFPHKIVYGIEVQRWKCRDCAKTFSQALPDMDERHHMTKRCLAYIRERGIPNTFLSVARDIGITEKTVRLICTEHFVGLMEKHKAEATPIMGIDELMLDGQMRAIFMDIGGKRMTDLIYSHHKRAVAEWLAALPNKDAVRIINIDMARPYRDVVQAILPNAKIVVDKFHIQRTANKALDKVRNAVRRSATGARRRNPWGPQRLLRKRAHNLSAAQEFEVDGVLANNPMVKAAYETKEAFLDIWKHQKRRHAELNFDAWRRTLLDQPDPVRRQFQTIARMVENWREEVFAYFDYPTTNAFTENRNGIVKLINRTGRGYSFPVIRAKALLNAPHPDTMGKCDACDKPYPSKSLKWVSVIVPVKDHRGKDWKGGYSCGSCELIFHTENAKVQRGLWYSHER